MASAMSKALNDGASTVVCASTGNTSASAAAYAATAGLTCVVLLPQGKIAAGKLAQAVVQDRKSTRLNSSHVAISYAVFCLKKKKQRRAEQHDEVDARR